MGTQCNRELAHQPDPVYKYLEKLTLSPYKKVYSINDTIWVQFSTTEKSLFDKLSGTRISTDTTNLSAALTLFRRSPRTDDIGFFCDITSWTGLDVNLSSPLPGRNAALLQTGCGNEPYFFKFGFILKKSGVYTLEPTAIILPCPDKKEISPSRFFFNFDLADCNKDIWLTIASQVRGGGVNYIDVGIDRKEIFVFRVE